MTPLLLILHLVVLMSTKPWNILLESPTSLVYKEQYILATTSQNTSQKSKTQLSFSCAWHQEALLLLHGLQSRTRYLRMHWLTMIRIHRTGGRTLPGPSAAGSHRRMLNFIISVLLKMSTISTPATCLTLITALQGVKLELSNPDARDQVSVY